MVTRKTSAEPGKAWTADEQRALIQAYRETCRLVSINNQQ